jgi:hypothetical protein
MDQPFGRELVEGEGDVGPGQVELACQFNLAGNGRMKKAAADEGPHNRDGAATLIEGNPNRFLFLA